MDTLPLFLQNIAAHDLKKTIKPLVMDSETASKILKDDISMVFIDLVFV